MIQKKMCYEKNAPQARFFFMKRNAQDFLNKLRRNQDFGTES